MCFGLKPSLVKYLVKNERIGRHTIAQTEAKRDSKEQRLSAIRECVADHIDKNQHIWKVQQI